MPEAREWWTESKEIRNLAIFHLVVLDNRTLAETGQAFDLSKGRVAQICGRVARREFDARGKLWWDIKGMRLGFQDA